MVDTEFDTTRYIKISYSASISGLGIARMNVMRAGAGCTSSGIVLVQIDPKDPENESVESRSDAVAKATNTGDHSLRDALLIDVRVVGYVGRYGRVADARYGR